MRKQTESVIGARHSDESRSGIAVIDMNAGLNALMIDELK